jgi:hypothetical protein
LVEQCPKDIPEKDRGKQNCKEGGAGTEAADRVAVKPTVFVDSRECRVRGVSTIAIINTKDVGILVFTSTKFDERVPMLALYTKCLMLSVRTDVAASGIPRAGSYSTPNALFWHLLS